MQHKDYTLLGLRQGATGVGDCHPPWGWGRAKWDRDRVQQGWRPGEHESVVRSPLSFLEAHHSHPLEGWRWGRAASGWRLHPFHSFQGPGGEGWLWATQTAVYEGFAGSVSGGGEGLWVGVVTVGEVRVEIVGEGRVGGVRVGITSSGDGCELLRAGS